MFFLILLACKKQDSFTPKHPTIINVPSDVNSIQEAINIGNDFDTILVSNGLYEENLNFNGKRVYLVSNYYKTKDTVDIINTIIKGNDNSAVSFQSLEDSTSIIDGFSIIYGGYYGSRTKGGGIYIKKSKPILKNLIIRNNSAWYPHEQGSGGGIYCDSGCIEGYNLIIKENWCGANYGGGAIHCENSKVILKNSTISNNTTLMYNYCGGLYFKNVQFHIVDSKIEHNYGSDKTFANGIFDSVGTFMNTAINDTMILGNSTVNFINCTRFGIVYP
jgi:hypothetical protein